MATGNQKWRAIGLPSVTEADLVAGLASIGLDWKDCAHVTANESTARLLRSAGVRAISMVELTDVIVWDAMPGSLRVPIANYPRVPDEWRPDPADANVDPIRVELSDWRRSISSLRAGFAIRLDNLLRSYLREIASDKTAGRVLRTSVRDLRSSMMFLIASNFGPGDFETSEPILRVASDAWQHLETEVPEVTNIRRDLWDEPGALGDPVSTHARDLRRRVDEALERIFGPINGRRQFVHHGFFFFTPQQWAMFHLLKSHPDVDQCFIVHDDSSNRAFETWRHYFIERWAMPRVEYMPGAFPSRRAEELKNALEGRPVNGGVLDSDTEVVGFDNPTEFVRHWRLQRAIAKNNGRKKPQMYAPLPENLDRVIERMSPGQIGTSVNLANLPVGQFLLALHECVEFDGAGEPELVLTADRLIDMAASGFLDTGAGEFQPSANVPALRRAMTYFSDVRNVDDWATRAEALGRLIHGEVGRFGPRSPGQSDVDRMTSVAANELRLIPWCDLSDTEARAVVAAVRHASDLVHEVVKDGRQRPDQYLAWIRKRLERAMAHLSADERAKVESKLQSVHMGLNEDLDLEGIREVVQIILGREVDHALDGSKNAGLDGEVVDVRSLDALGFRKSEADIHVANLAESVFPAKTSPYGWPFSDRYLKNNGERDVREEILRTRAERAQLGDLYLFWLALDGLAPGARLTFSWIARSGNETQNPSSLLTLLTSPKVRNQNVIDIVGGIELSRPLQDMPEGGVKVAPATAAWDPLANANATRESAGLVVRAAASSGLACPRRFAIQWAVGPSASFQSPHTQAIMFGNLHGVMAARGRFRNNPEDARQTLIRDLLRDLFRHLTQGQRASSYHNRVIKVPGARWHWIYTLKGSGTKTGPADLAYQAAKDTGSEIPISALTGGEVRGVLPMPGPGVDAGICNMCPVASRCTERVR